MPGLTQPLERYLRDPRLLPLADKVRRQERLQLPGRPAALRDARPHRAWAPWPTRCDCRSTAGKTYYVVSRRLSYTNICYTHCQFCAFQAKPGRSPGLRPVARGHHPGAGEARERRRAGAAHVAGHYPKLKIDYFEELFGKIKARFPDLHLKVFTMVEMDYYARASGLSTDAFLDRCIAAGLESCPGGGAEIFDEELREKICIGKKDAQVWLDTAELCHRKGLPTNCTMLYGHIEEARHRVDHLLRLRALQDRSLAAGYTGFLAYIPLAYQNEDNELSASPYDPRDHGHPGPARGCRGPAAARQHPAHQGLLGDDFARAWPRRVSAMAPTTWTAPSSRRRSPTSRAPRAPRTLAGRAGAPHPGGRLRSPGAGQRLQHLLLKVSSRTGPSRPSTARRNP